MESMYILVPLSILFAFTIGYFFWWSGKSGQFDDMDGAAHRILMDDDSAPAERGTPSENGQENAGHD